MVSNHGWQHDSMSESPADFEIRILEAADDALVSSVVELGDKHKKTLGLIPRGAFREYAERQRILVATANDRLVGYALFDLPANRIRLAQLCVADEARRTGVALGLVEALSAAYPDRSGIAVRCRRDWPAARVWPKLGFEPRSNAPGRSAAGHLVTAWWRDHGHPDLFSEAAVDDDVTIVALDSNVFRDLHQDGRPEGAESQALLADWLGESIELIVTAGLKAELNNEGEPRARERLLGAAGAYRTAKTNVSQVSKLASSLLESIDETDRLKDRSLLNDARLVAEAHLGGADAFVTRDENAVAAFAEQSDLIGAMWVSSPADFIVHLDELRDSANYRPSELLDTGYTISQASSTEERELEVLINHGRGENRRDFLRRARIAAAEVGHKGSRRVLRDPNGAICGGLFATCRDGLLDLSLIRATDPKLPRTIANQMVLLARQEARERGATRIVITDDAITPATEAVLHDNGFARNESGELGCAVVDGCLPWASARQRLEQDGLGRSLPAQIPSRQIAADFERVAWPLKIVDAEIPCFIIPIRPGPAAELLGHRSMLFGRDADLGLSRQHVYYRAPVPLVVSAPGRILWYVSGNENEVVAASRLDAVQIAHPGTLHRKFKRLGVLDRTVVDQSARDGVAAALTFSDTEIFNSPISLARLRTLDQSGGLTPLPSPRVISPSNFFAVYGEGDPQ